jgi:hypothetical protein
MPNVQMIHNPTVQQGSIFQVVQQFYQDATLFQFFNIRNRPMAVPYIYGLSMMMISNRNAQQNPKVLILCMSIIGRFGPM